MKRYLLPIFALALAPQAAFAQGAVELSGEVQVVKTVEEAGTTREVLLPPDNVIPGERLLLSTAFTNRHTEPVQNFVIEIPLPAEVALAEDGDFEVSVDGGKQFGPLASQTVVADDGNTRAALPNDVTHLRWTIALLPPGQSGQVQYHGLVR